MNYLEIILQGYFNSNNGEFLEKYFLREFKKAEKEHFFEADEFFNGCLMLLKSWEAHLEEKVNERKRELYLGLEAAKNGTLHFDNLEGKTVEEKRKESIEYYETELKSVRPDGIGNLTFSVDLFYLTNGRLAENLSFNELLLIKHSILKAFEKTKPNIEPLPPQQTETKTDKLKVPQIALIHVYEGKQITRENAGEIAAKHGYTAKSSGEGLFQDYINYCSMANRKGKPTPCTPKKLKNKIELFESVVNHLSDNNKQRAIDEINILKTILESEYQ